MKKLLIILFFYILSSCGYPDVDDVPNFNEFEISQDEIIDYCFNIHSNKTNIDKCIDDLTN